MLARSTLILKNGRGGVEVCRGVGQGGKSGLEVGVGSRGGRRAWGVRGACVGRAWGMRWRA